jgi:fucose permease
LIGRVAAQWILPRVRHTRLLVGSVLVAMFACLILLDTNNGFGAVSGVLLLGAAFAPIYPLVVEKIGHRFPYYHPGFYNGIFSFAMVGGLLAPCTLGYFAWLLDVRAVMGLPLLGSLIVFGLLILIWLEARLNALLHPST